MTDIRDHLNELKVERNRLKDEYNFKLEKLDEAIRALESLLGGVQSVTQPKPVKKYRRKIAWKSEITSLFNKRDTWSVSDIYEELLKKGLDIENVSGRSSISTTLSRLEDDGTVYKIEAGVFKRKEAAKFHMDDGQGKIDFMKGLSDSESVTGSEKTTG